MLKTIIEGFVFGCIGGSFVGWLVSFLFLAIGKREQPTP